MLVQGIHDQPEEIKKISDFLARLKPMKSSLAVPLMPPAEGWVTPPAEHSVNLAYRTFKEKEIDTEYLSGYEGTIFAFTGNIEADQLCITSGHPMKDAAGRDQRAIHPRNPLSGEQSGSDVRSHFKLYYHDGS
jgi:wyosine [tRNA(Phe)-imidazoG37] synthetase (radical SAM superfamily)